MRHLQRFTSAVLLSAMLALAPAVLAQTPGNTMEPKSADSQTAGPQNWTQDQLLTSTVHQAWLLSNRNEATFFEMVKQLAELSEANRGVHLPDSEAAGRRFGLAVKTYAKADTDQLLYAVVDKAVVAITKTPAHVAGEKR